MGLMRHGKVPSPFPQHVAKHVGEARALYDIVKHRGEAGAAGIVQAERPLSRIEHAEGASEAAERGPYGPGSFPEPYLPGEKEATQ
jgi:hypothetical protein